MNVLETGRLWREIANEVSRDYPELNSVVTIDGEGTIYLPKLGRIFVRDLSTNELNDLLNNAYKKYVKYPAVELVIKNYRRASIGRRKRTS